MSQRLSRQEIKRDEVLEGLSRTVDFSRRHARMLAWAGIGALAVLVATVGIVTWRGHRAVAAQRALAEALAPAGGPQRAALERVAAEHRGSDAADIANALLGELAAREGDLEEARRRWTEFLDGSPDSVLAAGVRLNLLALDRAQGRGEAVASELRGMLDAGDAPLPSDVVLYQLAVTLEALGRSAEAAESYQRLMDEHPDSVHAAAAQRRLQALPS